MRFYEKLKHFFTSLSGGAFMPKQVDGRIQIVMGIGYILVMCAIIFLHDSSQRLTMAVRIGLFLLIFLCGLSQIIRGIHTWHNTVKDPDYISQLNDIEEDERGQHICFTAAYTAICIIYALGIVSAAVLMLVGLVQAAAAVFVSVLVMYLVFDICRMCEENIS